MIDLNNQMLPDCFTPSSSPTTATTPTTPTRVVYSAITPRLQMLGNDGSPPRSPPPLGERGRQSAMHCRAASSTAHVATVLFPDSARRGLPSPLSSPGGQLSAEFEQTSISRRRNLNGEGCLSSAATRASSTTIDCSESEDEDSSSEAVRAGSATSDYTANRMDPFLARIRVGLDTEAGSSSAAARVDSATSDCTAEEMYLSSAATRAGSGATDCSTTSVAMVQVTVGVRKPVRDFEEMEPLGLDSGYQPEPGRLPLRRDRPETVREAAQQQAYLQVERQRFLTSQSSAAAAASSS